MTFSQTSPAWVFCEHPHYGNLESSTLKICSKDVLLLKNYPAKPYSPGVKAAGDLPSKPKQSLTRLLYVHLKTLISGMARGYLHPSPTHAKHKLCHPRLPWTSVPTKGCLHQQPSSSLTLWDCHTQTVLHMRSKLVSQGSTLLGRGAGRAGETQGREAAAKWKKIRKVIKK